MEGLNFGLEALHKIQLNMLKRLIDTCNNHGLSYYLAFGSLLGAVREHRIIPWDDSIDIVMPYQDYDILTNLPQSEWEPDLFMQTYYTDPDYPKCYAKLRNSRTTLIKADYADCDINQGIYINIMPLVNLADDADDRKKQLKHAKLLKALIERQPLSGEGALRLYSQFLLGTATEHHKHQLREELKTDVLKYEGLDTENCFAFAGRASLSLVLPKSWFASAVEWDFEGMKVSIPAGWHEWLSLRYGDYMVVPISDLQGDKLANFVTLNTEKPYTEYKGKTYCVE